MGPEREVLQSSVGFLYKTMLERDPCKRRVKPVDPHLLQLDFAGLDDSSDDSDFKINNEDETDVDGDEYTDDTGEEDHFNDGTGNDVVENESIESYESCESSDSETLASFVSIKDNNDQYMAGSGTCPEKSITSSLSKKTVKVLVCCVCLGDHSEQDNEIVECDSCGASVHEGCYGISEVESVGSSASSASTEPWFCDACKAGLKPHCELCPNIDGIFKETDANRWVHLVCALYVPGVAFGDVDKLSNVTLFEMAYSKWGAKECSLCEDERFRRTGVCICCDAGMCRTYFHVTCALREGLLTEAAPDEEIADPFFAHCRQHADKQQVAIKRSNWLTVQSCIKNFENHLGHNDKLRVQRKLTIHQQLYSAAKDQQPSFWVPSAKMPRMLITSAYALQQLFRKAERFSSVQQVEMVSDVQKKCHVSPTLSVDYIGYYLDRNFRIDNLKHSVQQLVSQNNKLEVQETLLHIRYEQLLKDVSSMQSIGTELQGKGEALWKTISVLSAKRLHWAGAIYFLRSSKSCANKSSVSFPSLFSRCDKCKKTHNQHLLVKCDKCHKHHHLGCLDPPLTRMPKKNKLQGWQCSKCVCQSSSEDDVCSEPRRLRHKYLIHEPVKYTSQFVNPLRKNQQQQQSIQLKEIVPVSSADDDDMKHDTTPRRTTVYTAKTVTGRKIIKQHHVNTKCEARTVTLFKRTNEGLRKCQLATDNSQLSNNSMNSNQQQQLVSTEREFYYSSRKDPMRQQILSIIEISDDELSQTND